MVKRTSVVLPAVLMRVADQVGGGGAGGQRRVSCVSGWPGHVRVSFLVSRHLRGRLPSNTAAEASKRRRCCCSCCLLAVVMVMVVVVVVVG